MYSTYDGVLRPGEPITYKVNALSLLFYYIVNLIINYLELITIGLLKCLTHPCWGELIIAWRAKKYVSKKALMYSRSMYVRMRFPFLIDT